MMNSLRVRSAGISFGEHLRACVRTSQALAPEAGDEIMAMQPADLRVAVEHSGVRDMVYRETGLLADVAKKQLSSKKGRRLSLTDMFDRQRKGMPTPAAPLDVWVDTREAFYFATAKLADEAKCRIRQCFEVAPRVHPDLAEMITPRCGFTFARVSPGWTKLTSAEVRILVSSQDGDGRLLWELQTNRLSFKDGKIVMLPKSTYDWCVPVGTMSKYKRRGETLLGIYSDRVDLVRDAVDLQHAIESAAFSAQPLYDVSPTPAVYIAGAVGQWQPDFAWLAENHSDDLQYLLDRVQFNAQFDSREEMLKAAWEALVQPAPEGEIVPVAFLGNRRFEDTKLFLDFDAEWLGRRSFWNGSLEEDRSLPVAFSC